MQRLVLPKGRSASRSSPTPTACKKQRLDSTKVPKDATLGWDYAFIEYLMLTFY